MNNYALLAGHTYYPCEGIDDLVGFFFTIDEAVERFNSGYCNGWSWDWGQVVNTVTWEVERNLGNE